MTGSRRRLRNVLIAGVAVAVVAGIATAVFIHSQTDFADQRKVCNQELQAVQGALYSYLAYNDVTTLEAATTNDMAHPVPLNDPNRTPAFIRNSHTTWAFTWDNTGRITAISQFGNGPSIPAGCVVTGA